jgi:DNA-binding transcriptional ArsR family regulator
VKLVNTLQLVSEPRRQQILRLLWHEEHPVGDLVDELELSYAGVSQHLALLRDAGFVTVRRDGKQRLYRADRKQLGTLAGFLESYWRGSLDRLASVAEDAERG